MDEVKIDFKIADLDEFEEDGHLERINAEFLKPLGYYLLNGLDAFTGDKIFKLIEKEPVEVKGYREGVEVKYISITAGSSLLSKILEN